MDTLEKRLSEVGLAHIPHDLDAPQDLDARLAGVDVKLAELRVLILLQNNRFTKLEAKLNELGHKSDANAKATSDTLAQIRDLIDKVRASQTAATSPRSPPSKPQS